MQIACQNYTSKANTERLSKGLIYDKQKKTSSKPNSPGNGNRPQSSIFEREYNYAKIKEKERYEAISQGWKNELIDCTFEPSISNPRMLRTFDHFLQEQRDHSKKATQKMDSLIREKDIEEYKMFQSVPSISKVLSVLDFVAL